VGKTASDLCIYTASGEKNQCHEINLWGFNTLYYPIAWSADDAQISFIVTAEDENPQIGILDLATDVIVSHPIPLYGAKFFRAYWSSDGDYLLYQTESDSSSESSLSLAELPYSLYLMDIKNEKTRLVTNESHNSCVAWLNNTSQFALLVDKIFTIIGLNDEDSVSVQATYKGGDVSGCPFSFSNDNSQIAFHAVLPSDATFGVFVASLSDGKSMLIDDGYYDVNILAWSPDDKFVALEALSGAYYIQLLSLDGWKEIFTVPGIPVVGPAWQPIG
jgi:Tol biopolymer transport system component